MKTIATSKKYNTAFIQDEAGTIFSSPVELYYSMNTIYKDEVQQAAKDVGLPVTGWIPSEYCRFTWIRKAK